MRLSSFFVTCRGRTGSIILIWSVFCIIHLSIALMLIFWSVVFVFLSFVFWSVVFVFAVIVDEEENIILLNFQCGFVRY